MSTQTQLQAIPRTEEQEEIVSIIGLENFGKLVDYFGGCCIYIPKKETTYLPIRNQKIYADFLNGLSGKHIAVKYGLSYKSVSAIIREMRTKKEAN